MYTVVNHFHGTFALTSYSPKERDAVVNLFYRGKATEAEKKAMRRSWNKLCGIKGCTCSNEWGER